MEELKAIYEKANLNTLSIDFELKKFRPLIKDLIIMVDYSKSMAGAKIINAIQSSLNVYDNYINQNDRVGYILFNERPTIMFSLNYKKNFNLFMRNILEKIPMYN